MQSLSSVQPRLGIPGRPRTTTVGANSFALVQGVLKVVPVDAFGVTRPDESIEHIRDHLELDCSCFEPFAVDAAAAERLRSTEH